MIRCTIQTQGRYLKKGKHLKIVPNGPINYNEIKGYTSAHPAVIKILGTDEVYTFNKNETIKDIHE